jgi:diaminopimelate epimerase
VEQCGNGVRCLASFLHRRGNVTNGQGEIVLDSRVGSRRPIPRRRAA